VGAVNEVAKWRGMTRFSFITSAAPREPIGAA
jgi:hypothetical protein